MKRSVFILLFIFIAVTISAQEPFKDFFKPVSINPNVHYMEQRLLVHYGL